MSPCVQVGFSPQEVVSILWLVLPSSPERQETGLWEGGFSWPTGPAAQGSQGKDDLQRPETTGPTLPGLPFSKGDM